MPKACRISARRWGSMKNRQLVSVAARGLTATTSALNGRKTRRRSNFTGIKTARSTQASGGRACLSKHTGRLPFHPTIRVI